MKKWTAKLKNDNEISESETHWETIKNEIKQLGFINNDISINLPENMEQYIQGKTASAFLGSNRINVESRYIGFKHKGTLFKLRIDEKTNNITIEID